MSPGRNADPIRVFLIEDDPEDIFLLEELIASDGSSPLSLLCAGSLRMAKEILAEGNIDVILLDLGLPDSRGVDTLVRALDCAQDIPIVVLTGLDDENTGVKAVQMGAQDYLIKGRIDLQLLTRSILYAITRHRQKRELVDSSLRDGLTGIYNRKGFLSFAGQQLRLVDRTRKGMILFFMDVDNMKKINDVLGHQAGDQLLQETAEILRETFRNCDIIARIGGDEFAVLVVDVAEENEETLRQRLVQTITKHNEREGRASLISLSVGAVSYDPGLPTGLEELMAKADDEMYLEKRTKKGLTP
ncbi:MAG: GGDEF domain-containing response regulator [Thermodesulfovibrionales bacterium]|jgi:diguanylate cyclase (GGDEF)-like protein